MFSKTPKLDALQRLPTPLIELRLALLQASSSAAYHGSILMTPVRDRRHLADLAGWCSTLSTRVTHLDQSQTPWMFWSDLKGCIAALRSCECVQAVYVVSAAIHAVRHFEGRPGSATEYDVVGPVTREEWNLPFGDKPRRLTEHAPERCAHDLVDSLLPELWKRDAELAADKPARDAAG